MSNRVFHPRTHVIVHRAGHVPGVLVPFLEIQAITPIDDSVERTELIASRMDVDAALLYDALTRTLPQGTIDRLFVKLAKRVVTMMTIARPDDVH